jgi:hypothetical protein
VPARSLDSSKLRTIIRGSIATTLDRDGYVRPREIVHTILNEHKTLLNRLADTMKAKAVAQIVQDELRQWRVLKSEGETLFRFAGLPENIVSDLPPTITVPVENEAPIHVVLTKAKIGQLRAYARLLGDQIRADQRNHRAVQFLVTLGEDFPDETPLREIFPSSSMQDAA